MTIDESWRGLYRAALMELRPEELRRQIAVAEHAVQQRIAELRRGDSSFEEERRELDDALRGLRFLASTECKLPTSMPADSPQHKATT